VKTDLRPDRPIALVRIAALIPAGEERRVACGCLPAALFLSMQNSRCVWNPPEARSLAVHALQGDRPASRADAQGLLVADPVRPYAHYVLATGTNA